jgi:hypothetical protein
MLIFFPVAFVSFSIRMAAESAAINALSSLLLGLKPVGSHAP